MAAAWISRAAEQGHVGAESVLGLRCAIGWASRETRLPAALTWLNRALRALEDELRAPTAPPGFRASLQ